MQHRVTGFSDDWLVGEPVPESAWHDSAVELLKGLLTHRITTTERDAFVFRNMAIRVNPEKWRVGMEPDLFLVEPAPPGAADLSSLKVWEEAHGVPALVIEVVSPGHPYKDYVEIPDMCAALGVRELIVFDPTLAGPKARGGPHRIQLWRRSESGAFTRVAAGEGSCESEVLGAHVVTVNEGRLLRFSNDAAGERLWQTSEEAALAQVKDAQARIAVLEAELRKRGG